MASQKGARAKGASYERELRKYLSQQNVGKVTNPSPSGYEGEDVRVSKYKFLCIEAKNHAKMNLPGWLKQAQDQCKDDDIAVVIHKKRGTTDMGKSYVTTDLDNFLKLLNTMTQGHSVSSFDKESMMESFSEMLDSLEKDSNV